MTTYNNKQYGSIPFENKENTYPKGRAFLQMYRVVPKTKRVYPIIWWWVIVILVFDIVQICLLLTDFLTFTYSYSLKATF